MNNSEEILKTVHENKYGFVYHPLSRPTDKPKDKADKPGKIPILTGWQKLTETPENIDGFIKTDHNIGIVCGKASNVTILDFDSFLFIDQVFNGFDLDTLRTRRTEDRGHVYFKYNPNLPASKHRELGIEVLTDGNNAVAAPSVHVSGDVYTSNNKPIIKMPKAIEDNLRSVFETEKELKQLIGKCRTCFKTILKDNPKNVPDMHGADGREYMIAVCADLKAAGAKEKHALMFSKLMYGTDYDETVTLREWGNIDPKKTWTCAKLKEKIPALLDPDQCERCRIRREDFKETTKPLGEINNTDVGNGNTCADCTYKPHGGAGFCKHKDHRKGEKDQKYKNVTDSTCSEFNEKKQAIIRSPIGGIRVHDIPTETIDTQPLSIQELIDEYRHNLYVDEDITISLPLAFVLSNHSQCDPDALGIIGPSGSGKTEVVRSLGDTENQYVYPISSLTARTFVSGYKDAQDLAPQLQTV